MIGIGVLWFLRTEFLIAIALVVAGVAILFARSWGYYIIYFLVFASLLPRQHTLFFPSLLPFAETIRHTLWLYAGFAKELTTVLLNLLTTGILAWTHYVLHQARFLNRPLTTNRRRYAILASFWLSISAILIPIALFIWGLIIDPPTRPGGPGVPSGGLLPFFAVLFTWPFVLTGVVGVVISWRMLRAYPITSIAGINAVLSVGCGIGC